MADMKNFQQKVATKAKGSLPFSNDRIDSALKILFDKSYTKSDIESYIKKHSEDEAIKEYTHSFIRELMGHSW